MAEQAAYIPQLRARFTDAVVTESRTGETTVEVPPAQWHALCLALRDSFGFEQLTDLCGVDYLGYGSDEWDTADVSSQGFSRGVEGKAVGRFGWGEFPSHETSDPEGAEPMQVPARRFAVVVHLISYQHNRRLRLRCYASSDEVPVVPSVTDIWPGANWFEREAFDLFGIVFSGHRICAAS